MRNIWLIVQREDLERVRTRSFIVLTLLIPAIMVVMIMLPAKLATVGQKSQHIVLVTSNMKFGQTVRHQLLSAARASDQGQPESGNAARRKRAEQDIIDLDANPTAGEQAVLPGKVNSGAIDGYLWLTDQAIAKGKVTFVSRSLADFGEGSFLSKELNHVILSLRAAHQEWPGARPSGPDAQADQSELGAR